MGCCILMVVKFFDLWDINCLVLDRLLIVITIECRWLNLNLLGKELVIILHIFCRWSLFIKHLLHKKLYCSVLLLTTYRWCIASLIHYYSLSLTKLTLIVLCNVIRRNNLYFLWFYGDSWRFDLRILSRMIALTLLLSYCSEVYGILIRLLLSLCSCEYSISISIRWEPLYLCQCCLFNCIFFFRLPKHAFVMNKHFRGKSV